VNKDPVIETIAERLITKGYVSLAHDLRAVWPRVNETTIGLKTAPTDYAEPLDIKGPGLPVVFVMTLQFIMFVLVVYIAMRA